MIKMRILKNNTNFDENQLTIYDFNLLNDSTSYIFKEYKTTVENKGIDLPSFLFLLRPVVGVAHCPTNH